MTKSTNVIFTFFSAKVRPVRTKVTHTQRHTHTHTHTHTHRNGQVHSYKRNLADLPHSNDACKKMALLCSSVVVQLHKSWNSNWLTLKGRSRTSWPWKGRSRTGDFAEVRMLNVTSTNVNKRQNYASRLSSYGVIKNKCINLVQIWWLWTLIIWLKDWLVNFVCLYISVKICASMTGRFFR